MKATQPNSDWQIQTAKARFSELFRRARTEGPQRVTRQGKESVMVIPTEEYEKLTQPQSRPQNLHDFLRQSPLMGVKLDLRRNKEVGRDIKL
jgi:prevent-host-death family protein